MTPKVRSWKRIQLLDLPKANSKTWKQTPPRSHGLRCRKTWQKKSKSQCEQEDAEQITNKSTWHRTLRPQRARELRRGEGEPQAVLRREWVRLRRWEGIERRRREISIFDTQFARLTWSDTRFAYLSKFNTKHSNSFLSFSHFSSFFFFSFPRPPEMTNLPLPHPNARTDLSPVLRLEPVHLVLHPRRRFLICLPRRRFLYACRRRSSSSRSRAVSQPPEDTWLLLPSLSRAVRPAGQSIPQQPIHRQRTLPRDLDCRCHPWSYCGLYWSRVELCAMCWVCNCVGLFF
jgi:hypothetical protein